MTGEPGGKTDAGSRLRSLTEQASAGERAGTGSLCGAFDPETGALILTFGGPADLDVFAGLLREGVPRELVLAPDPVRTAMDSVDRLDLRPGAGDSLLVKVAGNEVTIEGGHGTFDAWADELAEFQTENDLTEPGMHAHFDPSERPGRRLEMAHDSVEVIVAGPSAFTPAQEG